MHYSILYLNIIYNLIKKYLLNNKILDLAIIELNINFILNFNIK